MAKMRRRGRETADLGVTLVNEPRSFPGKCGALAKRSLRTMWDARGGGFYACGFVITFVLLEIRTLAGEIAGADGFVSFFTEQFFEFILRFSVQSITNTVYALIWPALVVGRYELYGIAVLGLGYLAFTHVLKEPLARWLFDGEPPAADAVSEVEKDR